jgi:hypothetical protein
MYLASILIPWRSDGTNRTRLWDYVRSQWSRYSEFELCVGPDDDNGRPFNRSRALNRAGNRR